MNAEQFLALAETLRAYALHSGRDTNDAHMFVHTVLMRAIKHDDAQGAAFAVQRKDSARPRLT